MWSFEPKEIPVRDVFNLLLGGVAPRPIALVSTCDIHGRGNLSPFSFFNCFGANPPIIAFSPSRRQRDASVKDTYNNIVATKECVVQAVTYAMVQQVNLASTEYPADVNEFEKCGLTPIPSDCVKPPRVQESPFQMECVLRHMMSFGQDKASANVALCEVVKFHIAQDIVVDGAIAPDAIDLVARMGADWYCRASGAATFRVKKPLETRGIGYDQIPDFIKKSDVFSANNLGQFGNVERKPSEADVDALLATVTPQEFDEALFDRAERRGDYRLMLALALSVTGKEKSDAPRSVFSYVQRASKVALGALDYDFAWKTALYSGRLK